MPNLKESAFIKIQNNLFRPKEEIIDKFSERELLRKARIMFCVTKKMEDPFITDKELVNFLTSGCEGTLPNVSPSTAYRDIAAVTRITGNVQLAAKDWYRYMIIEGGKRGVALAEKLGDPKGVAANLNVIGKYTQADKDDIQHFFDMMVPPDYEITGDPAVLDELEDNETKRIDYDKRRRELRDLYKSGSVVDIETVYVTDDE